MPGSTIREHTMDGKYEIYVRRRRRVMEDGDGWAPGLTGAPFDLEATYPCEQHVEAFRYFGKIAKKTHAFMICVPGTVVAITIETQK